MGDGNCAFNAFVLAVTAPEFFPNHWDFDNLPKDFIQRLAKAICPEKMQNSNADPVAIIKEHLPKLSLEEKQTKLAPLFREQAVEQAKDNPIYQEEITHALMAAFEDYVQVVSNFKDAENRFDDIFINHRHTTDKFLELFFDKFVYSVTDKEDWPGREKYIELSKRNNNVNEWKKSQQADKDNYAKLNQEYEKILDEAKTRIVGHYTNQNADVEKHLAAIKDELQEWWKKGFDYYISDMAKNGTWAGDAELKLLAEMFDVNMNVQQNNHVYHAYHDYGSVTREDLEKIYDKETPAVIQQLANRGVIDTSDSTKSDFKIAISSIDEIEGHLKAVDNSELVSDLLDLESRSFNSGFLSPETLSTLKQRNVLDLANNTFQFTKPKQFIIDAIIEISNSEKLITLFKNNIKNKPTICLDHQYGHWSNTQPTSHDVSVQKNQETENSLVPETKEDTQSTNNASPGAKPPVTTTAQPAEINQHLRQSDHTEKTPVPKKDANKWDKWMKDLEDGNTQIPEATEGLPSGYMDHLVETETKKDNEVHYFFNPKESKSITIALQIALDLELAKKLQAEFDQENTIETPKARKR